MKNLIEILFCIGAIAVVYVLINKGAKKCEESTKDNYRKIGLEYLETYNNVAYYGGFKDIQAKENNKVLVFKDRIQIFNKDIMFSNINDCSIQSESQLVERVSMGKLLCFGVLAFGMNGKVKNINKNYVVIRCNYKKSDIDLVLDFNDENENFIMEMKTLLN